MAHYNIVLLTYLLTYRFHRPSPNHTASHCLRVTPLLHKLAQLDISDHIYNWLSDFFYNHSHCNLSHDQQSSLIDITASIIHGFTIGPAAYVVTAGDLAAAVSRNSLCKFADDTSYLIIPASNVASRHMGQAEQFEVKL